MDRNAGTKQQIPGDAYLRRTWRTYHNRYWPTLYLIDKRGDIRYVKIGEGGYARTEQVIQALLAEP